MKCDRLHQATIYREGDCVILLDSDVEGREWVLKINSIIVYGPISLTYHVFVDGQYYVAKTSHGGIDYDSWTGQAKLIPRQFRRLCVQPTKLIDQKVMMYPITESPQYYLAIDPESPIQESTHTIFTREGKDCGYD